MNSSATTEIEYEIKPAGKLSLNFKELWQYKELFYFFTWRDIKVKYKQAYLGIAWVILQPLLMMLIFSLFFGQLLKVPSDGIPYPIFVFSGLLLWNIFSSGLASSGDSMISNSNIIKKIYFPRLIIPVSAVLISVFDFFIAFILFIGLLVVYQFPVNPYVFAFLFPIGFVIVLLTTIGMGCLLSALNVKYRDFRYILPFLIQVLMFLSPVLYPVSILPYKWAKYLLAINPLTGAISLCRAAIIQTPIEWTPILISIFSSLIIFWLGILIFRKTEAFFADLA